MRSTDSLSLRVARPRAAMAVLILMALAWAPHTASAQRRGRRPMSAGKVNRAGRPVHTVGRAGVAGATATKPPATTAPAADDEKADDKGDENQVEESSLYNCSKARGRFKVNLAPDVELKDLVTWAFSFTCKNFIYSSALASRSAKVTILSPTEMNAHQAWRVFLVSLQSMGLTVVPKGNVLEIIEDATAKNAPLPVYTKGLPSNQAQMVRAVLRPEHLSADDVATILTELKSKDGDVKALSRAGIVVITDYGSQIHRMASLMMAVDQPVLGERLYMIHVKYADATDLASTLNDLLGTKDNNTPAPAPRPRRRGRRGRVPTPEPVDTDTEVESAVPTKLMADERTNSLILLASEPAYLRVKALVDRLDVSVDVEGSGRIYVYQLENADAEEMATTLQTVITGVQPSPSSTGNNSRNNRGRSRAPTPAPGGAEGAAAFEGTVRVTQDKPTNSLVIVASFKDFLALRDVIKRLDVARPQVYIDASIVEVGVDNGLNLGSSWHAGAEVGDGDLILGGVQTKDLSSLNVASIANATGLIGGALGHLLPGAEQLLGQSIPSFGVLLNAVATTDNVTVLSSPHILTTDNEEAEIEVGQNIPYQSAIVGGAFGGAAQQGGSNFFPTQSIQRQDVELNLKLTPQINASDKVKLKIDLTINDIASLDFGGLGPSWSKRTLKDVVVVSDQQPVVLGGLISDKVTHTETKVPLLGDIPILGYLFKFSHKQTEKRNLLVMLTPYIVKNHTDLERIYERRIREQREFMRAYSSFRQASYAPEMDYSRKHGLVDEINDQIAQVEEEQRALDELQRRQIGLPDGPIEYSKHPASGDDDDQGSDDQGDDEGGQSDEQAPPEQNQQDESAPSRDDQSGGDDDDQGSDQPQPQHRHRHR